jgi:hypothetical protein
VGSEGTRGLSAPRVKTASLAFTSRSAALGDSARGEAAAPPPCQRGDAGACAGERQPLGEAARLAGPGEPAREAVLPNEARSAAAAASLSFRSAAYAVASKRPPRDADADGLTPRPTGSAAPRGRDVGREGGREGGRRCDGDGSRLRLASPPAAPAPPPPPPRGLLIADDGAYGDAGREPPEVLLGRLPGRA